MQVWLSRIVAWNRIRLKKHKKSLLEPVFLISGTSRNRIRMAMNIIRNFCAVNSLLNIILWKLSAKITKYLWTFHLFLIGLLIGRVNPIFTSITYQYFSFFIHLHTIKTLNNKAIISYCYFYPQPKKATDSNKITKNGYIAPKFDDDFFQDGRSPTIGDNVLL